MTTPMDAANVEKSLTAAVTANVQVDLQWSLLSGRSVALAVVSPFMPDVSNVMQCYFRPCVLPNL